MWMKPLLVSVALLSAFGCSNDSAPPTSEGVCCEMASTPCVGAHGARGGWAADESECAANTIDAFDGAFFRRTDERGCTYWHAGGLCGGAEDVCCGGVLPMDGGS